jgi:hypothetical protein
MKEVPIMAMTFALILGIISTFTSCRGPIYAQGDTTSGNVTAQIAPQGTSLNASSNADSARGNISMKG